MGFLLEFHEKRFHSSSLVPLKIPGHGTLGQSQVQPLPGFARRLGASNSCGQVLEKASSAP